MLSALFPSPEHLLLAQLIQSLTDELPIEAVRILILNDPKKQFPFFS